MLSLQVPQDREGSELYGEYMYFDTAAAAPPTMESVGAAVEYLHKTELTGPYLPSLRSSVYSRIEGIRADIASFMQARPEEIALTRNGTESICLIARGLSWQEGDEIILPDTEMISNVAIWRMLESELGVKIVPIFAEKDSGLLNPEEFKKAITKRTRLITLSALSNVTGVVQPVREICEIASSHGIFSHINASQALGMMPVGFMHWPCDFISACTRKGLRSIEGSGVLVVREHLIEIMTPTLVGWWNAGFDHQTGQLSFPPTGRRFEAGCPNVPAILALGAAVEVAAEFGIEVIRSRVQELTIYAGQKLRGIGAHIYGPQDDAKRLGILPFNVEGCDPYDLMRSLERQRIIIEAGHFMANAILESLGIEAMARVSLHYFNTHEEIDRLTETIRSVKGNLS